MPRAQWDPPNATAWSWSASGSASTTSAPSSPGPLAGSRNAPLGSHTPRNSAHGVWPTQVASLRSARTLHALWSQPSTSGPNSLVQTLQAHVCLFTCHMDAWTSSRARDAPERVSLRWGPRVPSGSNEEQKAGPAIPPGAFRAPPATPPPRCSPGGRLMGPLAPREMPLPADSPCLRAAVFTQPFLSTLQTDPSRVYSWKWLLPL